MKSALVFLTAFFANTALSQGGDLPFGQQTMAFSVPVVVASDQSAIPVSGTVTATNPSVGLTGVNVPTSATFVGAKDNTGKLAAFNVTAAGNLLTDGSTVTQPVSGTVTANQGGTWTVQPGNTANTTAWKVDGSAVTQPVSMASQPSGRTYADSVRNDYTGVSVTTGAWVQLIASTAAKINYITYFDSSGQTMELGTGAAAAETRVMIITPGGNSSGAPLTIPSGTRVSIRAVSGTANIGEFDLTGLN